MQIRDGSTVLLSISLSATANGSVFSVSGDALVLTIKKADIIPLVMGDEDRILSYDIVLSQGGLEDWFLGGDFVVLAINSASIESDSDVVVELGGETVDVTISGGNIGVGASVLLADLNQAVEDAEQAAEDATVNGGIAGAAAANAVVAGKADIDGENLNPATDGLAFNTVLEAYRRPFDKPLMDFVTDINAADWKPYFDAAVDWAAANAPSGVRFTLPRYVVPGGIPLSYVKPILSDGVYFVGKGRTIWTGTFASATDPCDIKLLPSGSNSVFKWGNNSHNPAVPGGFTQRGGGLEGLNIRGWDSTAWVIDTHGVINPQFKSLWLWVPFSGIRIRNGYDPELTDIHIEVYRNTGVLIDGTGEGTGPDYRAGRGDRGIARNVFIVGEGDDDGPISPNPAFAIRGYWHTFDGSDVRVVKGGGVDQSVFLGERRNSDANQRPKFITMNNMQIDYVRKRCIEVDDAEDVWFNGALYLNGSPNEQIRVGASALGVHFSRPRGYGSEDRMVTISGKNVNINGGDFRRWDNDGVSTEPCIYIEETANDVKIVGTTFGDPASGSDTSAGKRAIYAPPEATGSLVVDGCSFYGLADAPVDAGGMGFGAAACVNGIGPIKLETSTEAVEVLDYVSSQAERRSILDGTNTGDQISAINKAMADAAAKGLIVNLSGGKWRISSPIVLGYNGARISGAGPAVTTIEVIGATTKGIQTSDNINNWHIDSLKITRSTTGTSGGVGLDLSNVNSRGRIQNVWVKGHFNGVALGPTDYSEMVDCIIEQSVGDNIIMKNLSTDGTCQWSVSRVLSQFCGGRAFAFDAVAGPAQCIVGEVSGLLTFASTGHGFAINGLPGLPVQDVRLQSSFIGGAGDSNIFLNTYGKLHQINDCFIELAGQDKTGATYETLPSNVGSGIEITANNDDVVVNGSRIDANSHCGIRCEGGVLVLNGTRLLNNGLALAAGLRAGVRMFNAAKLFSSNVTSTNTGGNTSQQLGIYMYIGSGCSIVGGSVSGNSAINIGAEIDFHLCAVAGVEGGPTITPLVGTLGASYANDAAAAAGGVVLNQEYRNGSVKMIRVV